MIKQIGQEAAQVFAMLRQFVQLTQGSFGVGSEQRARERKNLALGGQTKHREDILFSDLAAAKAD